MTDQRFDDWAAANSALGSLHDKSSNITYSARRRLSQQTLEALYEQNAIAARVVDRIVDDSMREGWRLKNVIDRDGQPVTDLDSFYARLDKELAPAGETFNGVIKRGAKWSRLYGGSLVLMPTDEARGEDGKPREAKYPLIRPLTMHPLAVVHAYQARPVEYDAAFGSKTYLQTLLYQISSFTNTIDVHASRAAKLEPIALPPETLQGTTTMWGPSVLDRLYDPLSYAGAARKHAVAMMFVASLLFVKINNLRAALTAKGEREKAQKFLGDVQKNLSSMGMLALDKEDEIGSVNLTSTGAHELIDKSDAWVAANGEMPREILFNESPNGLRGGELTGAQAIWYAACGAYQSEQLTPAISQILDVAIAAWDLGWRSYEIEWLPLWTKSDDEQAETNSKNATADHLYWQMGALSSEEIREQRFRNANAGQIELTEAEAEAEPLDLSAPIEPSEVQAQVQAETEPAKEALNGAQISSLIAIVEKTKAGLIPRDAAIAIVRASFPSQAAHAEALLGSAGIVDLSAPAAAPDADMDDGAAPSTAPAPDDLLSPRDAAARFGLPTRAITLQIERGALSFWGVGNHKRVSLAEVAKLAKGHEQPAEPGDDGAA